MKPRSSAVLSQLRVFCQIVIIIALCASCIPLSPATTTSLQSDSGVPLSASIPVNAQAAAATDTARQVSPLNSISARVADQVQVAPAFTPVNSAPAAEPPLDLPEELNDKPEVVSRRTADSATFDLGNGQYALVQDSLPMHYQDKHDQWRRIDPSFTAVENGWMNNANSLSTGVASRNSRANITFDQAGIGWEPRSLQVVNAAGQATMVATMLDDSQAATGTLSADRRTLVYPASWSDGSLQDQWQSGYGRVEYSLRIAQKPAALNHFSLQEDKSENVELRVTLHLLPGTKIQAGGQALTMADLPLETREPLAFVNDAGETLWLQPPLAYEERNAATRIEGSYQLSAGANASSIELSVRMPYDWLAATDRQFPVILDPVFLVKNPTIVQVAGYDMTTHNFDGWLSTDPIGLGQYADGLTRVLVKFSLPTMPPEATVSQAYLEVLPRAGTIPCDYNVDSPERCFASDSKPYLTTNVEVVPLLNLSWYPQGTAPSFNPAQSLGVKEMSRSTTNATLAVWNITSLVNTWKSAPTSNYGVLIKLANEFCYQDVEENFGGGWGSSIDWTIRRFPQDCGFFDIDNPSLYVGDLNVGGGIFTGGIRLVVRYTAQVLNRGDTVTVPTGNPLNPSGLPTGDTNYVDADHEYQLQTLPSSWSVAAVRGIGPTVGDPNLPNQHDTYIRPLQGRLLTKLWDEDALELDNLPSEAGKVSWVALDGPAHTGSAPRLRLQRASDTTQPVAYDVWNSPEKGALVTVAPSGTQVLNYTFTSSRTAAIWNVQMPAGSNSRVDVTVVEDNIEGNESADPEHIDLYYRTYANKFSATLLKSGSGGVALSSMEGDELKPAPDRNFAYPEGSLRMTKMVEPAAGETYGLVVAYEGPAVKVNECTNWVTSGEFTTCDQWDRFELAFTVRVRVTSCPAGQIPLANGTCQKAECPDSDTFNFANYREMGDWGLWSANGWTAGGTSLPGDAVFIGPSQQPPTVLVGGESSISYDSTSVTINSPNSTSALVYLVNCSSLTSPHNPVIPAYGALAHIGAMANAVIADEDGDIGLVPSPTSAAERSNLYGVWREDEDLLTNSQLYILPDGGSNQALVKASTHYAPRMQGDSVATIYSLPVKVSWWHNWQGWSTLGTNVITDGAPGRPTLAGLSLDVGETFRMDIDRTQGDPTFVALRAREATISQPTDLGGASKSVQALILPKGQQVEGVTYCVNTRNCVDLRAPDDAYPNPVRRTWEMPDIHITGSAGLVMASSAGELQVWSADHPAMANSPQAVSQDFSFDTFGGNVSIQKEKCGTAEEVMVIRGETRMSLPMIGEGASPASVVSAGFKLCQNPTLALRQVEFEFYSPIGVPVGSSGLFVNGLKGTVEVTPDHSNITFGMDFYYSNSDTLQGHGDVTIDTRGMFAFQGTAKILGVVDADGRLWVAWNPLDTGFEMDLYYGLGDIASIDGTVRAHAWQGQGWQNKYSWLPPNNESHFAAQIAATFTLKEGAAIDMWPLVVPPVDLSRSIELAFGQFCTNSNCSAYEWGIKAALKVCGYTVGVYYGFDHGVDLVLGNDGHTLIDQYGGVVAQRVEGAPIEGTERVAVEAAPQAVDGIVTKTITITSTTEEFLVGLGWQAGDPVLKLYEPNGAEVVSNTAHTVLISNMTRATAAGTTHSKLIGVQLKQPSGGAWQPGAWHAVISNLNGQEHFKFAFLANKGAPGTPQDRGQFIAPGSTNVNGTGSYTIRWRVDDDAPISTTISLYYTRYYEPDPGYYMPSSSINNIPIVQHLNYRAGQYVWNTSELKAVDSTGSNFYYELRAVVDDGVNSFPETLVDDPCQPGSGLPLERAFDTNRFPGTSTFSSVGWLWVTDATPPATPTGLDATGTAGALLARWNRSTAKDLASYFVEWGRVSCTLTSCVWDGGAPTHSERVAPMISPTLRIGGVTAEGLGLGQSYGVVVSAIDINGNASPRSAIDAALPTSNAAAQVPSTPVTPTLTMTSSTQATLVSGSYTTNGVQPHHFRVTYRQPITFAAISQVDNIPPATTLPDMTLATVTLTGLQPGATYEAWFSAANSEGWHSAFSPSVRFVATNGVDADDDGAPDDWETAHSVLIKNAFNVYYDTDRDGLSNLNEYRNGTDPRRQDSDGDGFTDREEVDADTNPLDGSQTPAVHTQPRLRFPTKTVDFYAKEGQSAPAPILLPYYKVFTGSLSLLEAASTSPWISPTLGTTLVPGHDPQLVLQVRADTSTLAPGDYHGVVRIERPSLSPLIGGPYCVRVNLHLLPADTNTLLRKLHLPLIMRR